MNIRKYTYCHVTDKKTDLFEVWHRRHIIVDVRLGVFADNHLIKLQGLGSSLS